MSINRSEEKRYLSQQEFEAVQQTHYPELCEFSEGELAALRTRVRGFRDRARDVHRRQRREMRGKSPPRGAQPATDDGGTAMKARVLASAVKRLNRELERPPGFRQARIARLALALRQQRRRNSWPAPADVEIASEPEHADRPNPKIAPSGAFRAEGHRPVLERSRMAR